MDTSKVLSVRLYENSYQYEELIVSANCIVSQLFTGVLNQLNHQNDYRESNNLWATISENVNGKWIENWRLIRVSNKIVKVVDYREGVSPLINNPTQFNFTPLDDYSLTVIRRN
jgi:hypothetical protein